jgi:hypothetical protein
MKTTILIATMILGLTSVTFADDDKNEQSPSEKACQGFLEQKAEGKFNDEAREDFDTAIMVQADAQSLREKYVKVRVYQGHQGIYQTVIQLENEDQRICNIEYMSPFEMLEQKDL